VADRTIADRVPVNGICLDPVREDLLDPQGMALNLRPNSQLLLRIFSAIFRQTLAPGRYRCFIKVTGPAKYKPLIYLESFSR
jgi:hypothetical protein